MPRAAGNGAGGDRVWCRDVNDKRRCEPHDSKIVTALAAYTPTHSFRRDLLAYCRLVGVMPHPKLLPMHPDEEEAQGAETNSSTSTSGNSLYDLTETEDVTIKNWQLDHGNCEGLCFALALCPKIHSVCLFNVQLDLTQLALVCDAIPKTKVQSLQLEWDCSVLVNETLDSKEAAFPAAAEPPDPEQPAVAPVAKDHSTVYARLLDAHSPLVCLSLRANGITSNGAIELATALRHNTTLQSLNPFQNQIGDEGALAIAHALPYNTTLKTISVANNGITGERYATDKIHLTIRAEELTSFLSLPVCSAKALICAITQYEAPASLLKEIEDTESKIQAEIDHAKKAKKKIDRHTAMQNLGLPIIHQRGRKLSEFILL
ncbi:Lrr-containing protein, partial [Globisporangium splendens]